MYVPEYRKYWKFAYFVIVLILCWAWKFNESICVPEYESWRTFPMYKYEAGMWWARLSWKITIKSDCCISQTADFHTRNADLCKIITKQVSWLSFNWIHCQCHSKVQGSWQIYLCFNVWFSFKKEKEKKTENTVCCDILLRRNNGRQFLCSKGCHWFKLGWFYIPL